VPTGAPVFRPTWLPARFRRQPPGPPAPGPYTGVTYRGADGDSLVFAVGPTNSAPPTANEPFPVLGDDARLFFTDGSPPLQIAWTEQGRPYAIRGEAGTAGRSTLTRDELRRIAVGLAPVGADGAFREVSPAKTNLLALGGSGITGVTVPRRSRWCPRRAAARPPGTDPAGWSIRWTERTTS
jgi:hypothetical protein